MEAVAATERETALRQELKLWEAAFAAQHDGRKATREEIKLAGGDIASKYKDYHRLRQRLPDPPAKSAAVDLANTTPSKRRRWEAPATTPIRHSSRRSESHRNNTSITNEAAQEAAATPQRRLFVGPTPQKDGLALSLFDALPLVETPSHSGRAIGGDTDLAGRPPLALISDNAAFATPSKRGASATASTCASASRLSYHPAARPASPSTTHKHSRTPQTPGTRNFLSSFVTPSKRPADFSAPLSTLPAGLRALSPSLFNTPAFLRRDNRRLSLCDDDAAAAAVGELIGTPSTSTQQSRRATASKRRNFCRSLSSLIAEARAAEEERFEDEVAAMREVERGYTVEDAADVTAAAPLVARGCRAIEARVSHVSAAEDVVPETRAGMLGPDGVAAEMEADAASDAMEEPGPGRTRVWKKRGAKRQHRKVVLRPTAAKPSKLTTPRDIHAPKSRNSHESPDASSSSDHDSDGNASADGNGASNELPAQAATTTEKKKKSNKPKTAMSSEHAAEQAAKAARRASKHANFCRLKIRGNAKADARKSGFRGGKGAKGRR